jgi:NAD(P)-dependent dehydrogenase (short-subunit alcohol dehydrogenase family)
MNIHGTTILVTGATGNQGGTTARHLLADGWHVRALVCNDTTPGGRRARRRRRRELGLGDLDDRASYDAAVRGAYGAYSVHSANDNEVARGKNIADAAKAADMRHPVTRRLAASIARNRFYVEQGRLQGERGPGMYSYFEEGTSAMTGRLVARGRTSRTGTRPQTAGSTTWTRARVTRPRW